MYHIRKIILRHGEQKKTRLVIEFDDPRMAIVGELFMVDVPMLEGKLLKEIDDVLDGKEETITSIGNRCAVTIARNQTKIEDLYEGIDGIDAFPSYEMDTVELRKLASEWLVKRQSFEG